VILDFDGTLADSWPWFLGQLDDTARRFGHAAITREEAEALRGVPPRDILRRLGIPAWQVPAIAAHLRRAAQQAPPPPLFPGIPALLRRLAGAGVTLAVASSNSAAQIARSLGPALDLLIAHRASEASLFGKAARFRRLLRESGTPPGAALAIGDEVRDIEAARAAGIAVGAVTWGYATEALLAAARPDVLFRAPPEIAAHCGA
jgi:phosphoglycolate phosphatase